MEVLLVISNYIRRSILCATFYWHWCVVSSGVMVLSNVCTISGQYGALLSNILVDARVSQYLEKVGTGLFSAL